MTETPLKMNGLWVFDKFVKNCIAKIIEQIRNFQLVVQSYETDGEKAINVVISKIAEITKNFTPLLYNIWNLQIRHFLKRFKALSSQTGGWLVIVLSMFLRKLRIMIY